MLLRSSSAPVLSASVIPEGNDSSSFDKPFAASHPLLHSRGFSPNHTLPMRRALSEADLQGRVFSSTEADDQKRAGEQQKKKKLHHSFFNLPIIEEKKLHLSTSFSEWDRHRVDEKEDFVEPFSGEGGSVCSPASTSSCVSAPTLFYQWDAMNSTEMLNPLLMASGAGISSKADQALVMNVGGDFYGCDGGSGSSGGWGHGPSSSPHGGDSDITDLYYQKLLQSDPQNPLLLRNYAQFLSEAKHDYKKSEEYYERAILACPNDGEVLSKYAKHVWDVHKDSERAGSYFDQAVTATPDDCYVLASYAAFLWQSEEDEEDNIKATKTGLGPLHETCADPSPLVASG